MHYGGKGQANLDLPQDALAYRSKLVRQTKSYLG